MLKCGSSSYFGEHENSRTCLGAHIAFSSAENQGVNHSQMNCSWTISDDTGETRLVVVVGFDPGLQRFAKQQRAVAVRCWHCFSLLLLLLLACGQSGWRRRKVAQRRTAVLKVNIYPIELSCVKILHTEIEALREMKRLCEQQENIWQFLWER